LLALLGLKDLEHQVILEAEALGLPRGFPMVGPEAVLGLELNPYAAELARVTVWIGEIQWMLSHGFNLSKNPILKPLNTIEQRDAIVNQDGTEPEWPTADVIVGNPPF
ncbi:class I SAM-dependent DNA methyltransferase, partial [bacterium]|nr:class I SAM-dependent DNA methyltransferase [bacterium]